MIKKLLVPSLFCLMLSNAFAQSEDMVVPPHRTCGTMEHFEHLKSIDPNAEANKIALDNFIADYIQKNPTAKTNSIVTIPTVFHVVYSSSTQNITDQRLLDQLTVLNQDYSKSNSDTNKIPAIWRDTVAADCEVQFCMAQQTPWGYPTDGITRTATTVTSWSTDDKVKKYSTGGHDAWDRNKYLNIWVCNLGGGLLGYAQFPGQGAATDGVVFAYQYVGTTGATSPYNKGRTATHEVGHWLNLYHIWGDDGGTCSGSDQVTDTPNQKSETYGCFTAGAVKTDACSATAPGYMWQNYMDYTDDACMYMFTNGQKARMQGALAGSRSSLATSNGCQTPVAAAPVANFIANPTSGALTSATPTKTINFYDQTTGIPDTWAWSASPSTGITFNTATSQNPTATFTAGGTYTITLVASNSNGSNTKTKTSYIVISSSLGIESVDLSSNIELFPNPSIDGLVNLNVAFDKNENVQVFVTNILGEKVYSFNAKNVLNEKYTLDLSTRAKGNYFVTIKTENGQTTKRVAVVK